MRIVRIADLSEEERKKALQKQEERFQKNEEARQSEIERVNKLVDEQRIQEKMDKLYEDKSDKSFSDRLKYIGSNLGTGILSGTVGIGQSGLTDMANQMNKGSQASTTNILKDSINAITGLINPMQSLNNTIKKMPERIGNTVNTVTDKDKSVVEKITTIGLDASNAPIEDNQYKNLFDVGNRVVGKINPNASDEVLNVNNIISKPIEEKQQKLAEEGQEYDAVTQTIGNVSQVIGNMLPSVVASALTRNPNIGLSTMALSTKGQATQEALNKGAELDKAVKIGNTKAMIEVGTEMLTGGVNIFGKGAVDDIIQKGIDKRVKNEVANFLIKKGLDIPGEIIEETISDVLGTTIDKGTVDPNTTYSFEDFGDTALTTILSTIVLNAITGGYGKNAYNVNKSNILPKAQDITNNANVLPRAQIIQTQNQVAQNSISEQIEGILNNKELPMQSYQYELSDNAKINNLRQDANRYFNNLEKARNYVSMLEKIITDKDIEIRLDGNLKTIDGRIANGSYYNGVITINPNSTRAGEFIAIHELTHAIGTKEMLNMVNTYRNSNPEFDTAVKGLLKNYEGTEITEEALSDVAGQLFGNQEFINNIAQNNPNIFQKLYSEIKYLWHQFRGYKNQNQFVEDLYYKWTQAYNSKNKLNGTKNYSIAGKNAKNANINNLAEAVKLEGQGKTAQEIYEQTGWYRGNESKWRFEIDDSNAKIILNDNKYTAMNTEYSLSEILDFKEIYEAYPNLKNIKVKFVENQEYTGRFDKDNIYIDINEYNNNQTKKYIEDTLKMLDSKNAEFLYSKEEILKQKNKFEKQLREYNESNNNKSLKSVLLHEIQHYIQETEDFSRGNNLNNAELSKEKFIDNFKNKINNLEMLHNSIGITENMSEQQKQEIEKKSQYAEQIKELKEELTRDYDLYIKIKDMTPFEIYKNTAGEQEAVDVQNRMNLTTEERKLILPFVKNKNMIYNTNKGIINGGDKSVLQKRKESIFSNNEQFGYDENNDNRDNRDNFGYNQQGRKSNTESRTGIETDGKGSKYDNIKDLGNDKEIIKKQESENNSGSFNLKEKQLDIINKNNPMQDEYHTGIRSVEDIKTLEETLQDSDWVDYDEFNPDYTRDMAEEAVHIGKIIVYSSYPIKQGVFISPSYMEAESYSSNGKVYSKEVNIKDIAWIDPTQGQYAKVNDKYSINNDNTWQEYLDENFKPTGTRTSMQDILPTAKIQSTQNVLPTVENNVLPKAKKKLNPTEIANLTIEDANTTPILPQKNYTKGNKQSSFFRNVIEDAQFLNKDLRQEMSQDENIRYYKGITNAETLEKAYTDLQNGGQNETMRWFNKENKDISAEDIAKGWILLKQYQDSGDYQGAVEVAKKMRNMGTKAGQAVQAYNILSRLTPEGMFYYAQSELSEAYNKMSEGKSKEWIDDNKSKFDLTPEETQIIKEKMESIQGIEDERTKKITLAEIQKMITDKIPPTASQSVKSWMRISMLFNPKTQVRNVAGNAVILPVNMTSDFIASGIDRAIAKKTGVRTTGNTNLKNYAKGFRKGIYESYDDFRKGINTRNIEGNRFEVTEGKNFKDKGIGKALNKVDNMLSFMLDAGDRGFYEATFVNSINNQLVLNNTTKITADMIDIATQEALQRTWQDNNTYTNAVLKIRKLLNFNKGYGLGDILIPFAKTPANLTKAIVDYSPVGLTKTLAMDARKLNNSLQNGQYTPQLQHKFVQDLGKGMAGSLLYILGYALAKAGVITGESDEDKDVKNFMKNSLGINSYSIKIGDKSFAYDWAQPVATPFAIMANFEKYNRENPDASVIDKAINSINIGTEQLLQQSFMESINTVLNGNGTTIENLSQAILELPSRAIPTLSKQITDMVDGTQRTSFEYGKPVESAINSVKAKIPGLSQTLAPSVDTLGNEIQKYGGNNNLWNVMFNPANMNKGQLSKAGEEIYNVYMETGDATLLPRTAPYYIDSKGEKKTMTSMQRSEFQKITGKYVENTINGLLNNKDYKKLSNDKKAELINEIVSDSYSKAKYDVLKIDSEQYEKIRNTLKSVSTTSYYDYKSKTKEAKKDSEKLEVLVDANYTKKEKQTLYENYIKSKTDEKYDIIKTVNNFNISTYLEYKLASSNEEFKADRKDDGTVSGKAISGSAKDKKYNFIINMKDTPYMQKVIMFGLENTPNKTDKSTIVNYISSLPGKTNKQKLEMLDQFSWITVYKDGKIKY